MHFQVDLSTIQWSNNKDHLHQQLEKTFQARKDAAMSLTVACEVGKCPALQIPEFVSTKNVLL